MQKLSLILQVVPDSKLASAFFGAALTAIFSIPGAWISAQILGDECYGFAIGVPFCLGFISVLVHSYHHWHSISACMTVALLTTCIYCIALTFIDSDYAGTLPAAPSIVLLSLLGATVARTLSHHGTGEEFKS